MPLCIQANYMEILSVTSQEQTIISSVGGSNFQEVKERRNANGERFVLVLNNLLKD
jgi:hypothetical protein